MKKLKEKKMIISNEEKDSIISHYKNGYSIPDIGVIFCKKYTCMVIAGIIAEDSITIETTIQKQTFIIVPSKMNYNFRMQNIFK
jgi:hypothetical protein